MDPDFEGLEDFAAEQNAGQLGVAGPNAAVAVVMPLNGGIQNGIPWTGGSRDPDHRRNTPLTPMCS